MGAIITRGPRSKRRYYAQYRERNGVRRTKLLRGCKSMEKANGLLAGIELNITEGKAGIEIMTATQQARASVTVGELSARFLGDVDGEPGYAPPSVKDLNSYRIEARSVHTRRILPTFRMRAAASVTVADVERLRDAQIAGELTAASVVQTLAALSKLFEWGRKVGMIECANPARGVERPRVTSSLDYLSHVEVGQLLAYAEVAAGAFVLPRAAREAHPMIACAVFAGLRLGELYGLRWIDVDFERKSIAVARSYTLAPKSGKTRHVPLHPDLAIILRVWKRQCPATADGLCFPVDAGRGPRMGTEHDDRALGAFLIASGCHAPADGKPWHMLRHTFASHAVMSGASLYDVQALLGHSTPQMTQRYSHLAPSHLAGAVAKLSFAPARPVKVDDLGEHRRRQRAAKRP